MTFAESWKPFHEPSSVFIYEMIQAYGGPEAFYKDFYINSPCPPGFTSVDLNGREKEFYIDKYLRRLIASAIQKLFNR